MAFGLIVIGDEILSGKRQDQHFAKVRELLAARGLKLAWAQYLGDERPRLIDVLRQSFAGDDVVFSCGGIGATPDDHTRQSAAAALAVPLVLHAGARDLIARHMVEINQPLTPERLRMGELPQGAALIPNPYNRIPGFSIRRHHFVPGFPVMAWPMIEWVLDTHYRDLFGVGSEADRGMIVRGLNEGTLTPLMDAVEKTFPGIRVYSLPCIDPEQRFRYEIDLGVKGALDLVEPAFARLQAGVLELGGTISAQAGSET
ncbi:MAG: competence/damage-inducible protein A [Hydrogenophilales bacterium 28-61-23]|nr:MAG: competence/damage-inducible protein A [Hydrogenophilales bacterium 28-61-23]